MGLLSGFSRLFMRSAGKENPWEFWSLFLGNNSRNQGKEGQGTRFTKNTVSATPTFGWRALEHPLAKTAVNKLPV